MVGVLPPRVLLILEGRAPAKVYWRRRKARRSASERLPLIGSLRHDFDPVGDTDPLSPTYTSPSAHEASTRDATRAAMRRRRHHIPVGAATSAPAALGMGATSEIQSQVAAAKRPRNASVGGPIKADEGNMKALSIILSPILRHHQGLRRLFSALSKIGSSL